MVTSPLLLPEGPFYLPDNVPGWIGSGKDGSFVLLSAALAENTAAPVAGVHVGTVVGEALAADSIVLSNITLSGDLAFYTNVGGNSIMGLWLDGSSGDAALLAASGASVDHYINGTKRLDHAAAAFAFQEATTISTTAGDLTLSPAANITSARPLVLTGVGPHAIGGAVAGNVQLRLSGDAGASVAVAFRIISTLNPDAGANAFGVDFSPTIVEAGSGTHGIIAALNVAPIITAGGANVTDLVGIDVATFAAAATTTRATGLRVAAPTGATTNYAINVTSGDIYKAGTAYNNPAYVLEHWATGKIVKFADRDGAAEYQGLRSLSLVETFAREHYELPLLALRPKGGLFDRGDMLLASVEESYLYLFDHESRLQALEKKLAA